MYLFYRSGQTPGRNPGCQEREKRGESKHRQAGVLRAALNPLTRRTARPLTRTTPESLRDGESRDAGNRITVDTNARVPHTHTQTHTHRHTHTHTHNWSQKKGDGEKRQPRGQNSGTIPSRLPRSEPSRAGSPARDSRVSLPVPLPLPKRGGAGPGSTSLPHTHLHILTKTSKPSEGPPWGVEGW